MLFLALTTALLTQTSTVDSEVGLVDEAMGLEDQFGADEGPKLTLYGFMDFTYTKTFTERHTLVSDFVQRDSFAVGSLNLYLSAQLSENWRSLAEVQFLYAPNGTDQLDPITGNITTTRTSYFNVLEFATDQKWGGILIQRAFLEYQVNELLTLRAGQWLTPVGIWNVDHGSPTIIGVRAPYMLKLQYFPAQQTGLSARGDRDFGTFSLGYELTLSNGRGPFDSFRDLDQNKGMGGRAVLGLSQVGRLTLGFSAYYGRYTDAQATPVVDTSGATPLPRIETAILTQYDELCFGADLRWEWGGLVLIGEAMINQRRYTEEGRPLIGFGLPGLRPDHNRWGAYGLLGYRVDLLGLMPFVMVDYFDLGSPENLSNAWAGTVGLNVRPIPAVVIKAQLSRGGFEQVTGLSTTNGFINTFDVQAAWAF